MRNNDDSMMFVGGAAAVIIFGAFVVKLLGGLMREIGNFFVEVGRAGLKFGIMIQSSAWCVFYLSLIAISVYCIYWYIKKLNEADSVEKELRRRIADDMAFRADQFSELRYDTEHTINRLTKRIEDAIKPVEVKPDVKALIAGPTTVTEPIAATDDCITPSNQY